MKAAEQVREPGIAQALMRGACPICALLREFQNELTEAASPNEVEHLCNFHAWSVAHATTAKTAIAIFLRLLDSVQFRSDAEIHCDLCSRIWQEEDLTIHAMANEIASRPRLMEWMLHHGSICIKHATKLQPLLPLPVQNIVSQIVQRNIAELKQELEMYRRQLEQGGHAGGGILGKVAELLVSQRGITR